MSRILRMAVYAGVKCLETSGVAEPDGIITATGKGNLTDTEKFLKDALRYNEASLNPTPFILSTYNAVSGAIALQSKATGYNQTFVHRGSSLEIALLDAQMKLSETETVQHILAGGFDEITQDYIQIKDKLHYWKEAYVPQKSLWEQSYSPGSLAGEGAAFFMLTNQPGRHLLAMHRVLSFTSTSPQETGRIIREEIAAAGWHPDDIDGLVLGLNGNCRDYYYYDEALTRFPGVPVMVFKHLCGEYETATGFGLWLLTEYLAGNITHPDIWYPARFPEKPPEKILYYNHFRGSEHNLLLLAAGPSRQPVR